MSAACLSSSSKACYTYFTAQELSQLDRSRIPQHIAIIPDGNRRWAKQRQAEAQEGHQEGADVILDVVKAAKEIGVKVITLYIFSTENWQRATEEIDALMWLLHSYLIEQQPVLKQNGVRLNAIGDLSKLPDYVLQTVQQTIDFTKECNHIDLVLAINYGGRNELCRAFKKIALQIESHELTAEKVNEELIASHLDTCAWPDPDLLIRTSGENRISNFLLWQLSYSEIYVTETYWPEFRPQHLLEATLNFQKRIRRLGGA